METVNRRQFLTHALAAVPVIVAGEELLELLAPRRTIVLPPRGGWLPSLRQAWPTTSQFWFDNYYVEGFHFKVEWAQVEHLTPEELLARRQPVTSALGGHWIYLDQGAPT